MSKDKGTGGPPPRADLDDPHAPIPLDPRHRKGSIQTVRPEHSPIRGKQVRYQKQIDFHMLKAKVASYLAIGVSNQHVMAEKIGVSQPVISRAIDSLTAEWAEKNDEALTRMRHKQQIRLDLVFAALWPRVQSGDVKAVREFVLTCQREAALWGLDAPQKVQHSGPTGTMLDLASILGIAQKVNDALPPLQRGGIRRPDIRDPHNLPALPPGQDERVEIAAAFDNLDDLLDADNPGSDLIEATWEEVPDPPTRAHEDRPEPGPAVPEEPDDDWLSPV